MRKGTEISRLAGMACICCGMLAGNVLLTGTSAEAANKKETNTEQDEQSKDSFHEVVDHAGNTVWVPDNPERIVIADTLPLPSVLSLFLGSADKIAGISPVSMSAAKNGLLGELYPEILEADTSFFANSELNIEALIELEPDLVFYNEGNSAIEDALKSAGLTGIAVSVTNWDYQADETFVQWLRLLEDVFPEQKELSEQAETICKEIREEIEEQTETLSEEERKDVFYLFQYNDAGIVTSGERFWGQFWADAAGANNVSKEVPAEKSNAIVNMEQIYEWDPDIIFITNFTAAQPEDLYDNAIGEYDWSLLTAVSEQQVYKMPLGAYRSFTPGADTPMTMLWTAKQVYPELFEEVDLEERVMDYYKELYDVELTEEQIAQMYQPSSQAADGYRKN